jgi:glycosyl hydrolase family 44
MTARKIGWLLVALLTASSVAGLAWVAFHRKARMRAVVQPSEPTKRKPTPYEVTQVVFDGGLSNGWRDRGWAPHELGDAGPARIRFSDFGSVILQHEPLQTPFGALVFRFQAPASWPAFLRVSLKYKQFDERVFPPVSLGPEQVAELGDGWNEAFIPWPALNPSGKPFDRIAIEASRLVGSDWVLIDHVVLTKPDAATQAGTSLARDERFIVDCNKPPVPISPLIYGIANGSPGLGETAHRVGGNTSTRLNWDIGNIWNTGSDWYFENVEGSKTGLLDWLDEGRAAGIKMAVTVPMIGWVAKDTTAVGFPISRFGPQRAQDPGRGAGDGYRPDGTPLAPDPPTTTSVAVPPDTVRRWITNLRRRDAGQSSGVWMYILDNEPDLWHATHRDVHPDPVGYDELLDRTLRYGAAIRESDPDALIAGPASWGWTGYFYSAKDSVTGVREHADRRAHGDVPLLAWYLRSLAEHEKRTGVRLLDVLDVHFYPQADGVYGKGGRTDPETAALRLRSTRALWDVTYRDESWIDKTVYLVPRLKELVSQNYPDRGISIGEWSFGAEDHMSGALAIAESLGRFGQFGVTSAFYWFGIPPETPAFQAFRAFRNFDGKGGRFLDLSIPTQGPPGVSLFASRDTSGSHIVAVALNLDPTYQVHAEVDLSSCGGAGARRVFTYTPGMTGLSEQGATNAASDTSARVTLPPYSINVIDITTRDRPKR